MKFYDDTIYKYIKHNLSSTIHLKLRYCPQILHQKQFGQQNFVAIFLGTCVYWGVSRVWGDHALEQLTSCQHPVVKRHDHQSRRQSPVRGHVSISPSSRRFTNYGLLQK